MRHEAERQDALLLMREAAEGHLKLALGAKLLAWAVNRYSERKHEPLLKAASSIFASSRWAPSSGWPWLTTTSQ